MAAMFRNTAFSLGAAALALAAQLASPAQAAYVVSLQQVGANVVATGSGTIDLTDLTGFVGGSSIAPMFAGIVITAPANSGEAFPGITGPASFGSGGVTSADSGTGDFVALIGGAPSVIGVPVGYVSGHALSDTSTYNNATFASLGVTPGTYEWTWGSGVDADSFTLQIGPVAAVPEPASLPLLVMGLAGLGMVVRRRRP